MTIRNADPLVSAFARLEERTPRSILIRSPSDRFTVEDVGALSRQLQDFLNASSIGLGRIVGLAAPNGPGFLAGFIALRTLGHPVLLIDAMTPDPERLRAIAKLGAVAFLATKAPWPTGTAEFSLTENCDRTRKAAPRGELAIIKLSSGSTGEPRGVAVSTEALIADDRALVRSMGIRGDDIFLATVPFSHSYGFSSLVLPALLRGNPLVLPDGSGPLCPLNAAAQAGATVFPSVPSYFAGLANASIVGQLPESFRLIISAGAPLQERTARRFRTRFGKPIHVFYGASECGGIAYDREGSAGERGTVGAPLEGVSVTLEPKAGSDSSEGRVVVKSPAVAKGYLPAAEDRLVEGCFRTDDLGSWVDGELELLGKVSQVINVHGRKVQPKDVERVIMQLDAANEVAVTGGGDGAQEWVEAVVACTPGDLSVQDVISWCRRQLAPFKIPRKVVLVAALPRNHRGKIDRVKLRQLTCGSAEDGPTRSSTRS